MLLVPHNGLCALLCVVGAELPMDAPGSTLSAGFYVETRALDLAHIEVPKASPWVRTARGEAHGTPGIVLEPKPDGEASFTSGVVSAAAPFRDVLVSWNVETPTASGFAVELRVAAASGTEWSPWLYVGDWGVVPKLEKVRTFDGGVLDTDYLRGEREFGRAELRVRAFAASGAPRLFVERLTICFSNRQQAVDPFGEAWGEVRAQSLDVPCRSQKAEAAEIAGRICSPTSLAMVMAYRGVERSTLAVASAAFDAEHDIYGNWPRNVQAAFSFGVPGYLTRLSRWREVEAHFARGEPLIASISVKPGELDGAPYKSTAGHLIVLVGFTQGGDVIVNDPAARDAEHARLVYSRAQLQRVWMGRGGTAYVLLAPR
jgi:hypothetical protein